VSIQLFLLYPTVTLIKRKPVASQGADTPQVSPVQPDFETIPETMFLSAIRKF